MILRAGFVAIITFALAFPTFAIEAPLPRHPAPSPDGSTIAFSWQGDIWLVGSEGGTAARLTANPATERLPIWSRDGKTLAFASQRHGNDDIFVMPADGSRAPHRLTFASTEDTPMDFTPDGGAVVFSSNRFEGVRWGTQLWAVPLEGGTPRLIQDAFGRNARYSPDGEALAFVRGESKWQRRGYRGSASRDLWLRDSSNDYIQLTDFEGTDDFPSWIDGHTLVFLSDRDGRKNVYLLDLVTGTASQITEHDGSAVRFPRASADGGVVAYEFEDSIWTVSPSGGTPTRLRIEVPADELVNPVKRHTATAKASELAISPDGKLAAFLVHGDVFVTAVTSKDDQKIAEAPTARVTSTPAREENLSWSPDGKQLLFTSARNGNLDLYLAQPVKEDIPWNEAFDFSLKQLTDSPVSESSAAFSPDGDWIAFIRNAGDLVVIPAQGGSETVLFEHWSAPDFSWSPDGQWIAYSVPDESFNSEVWIIPATGGTPWNISRHPDDDLGPNWSPDGRRLVWTSKRHADTFDIWGVWLTRADHERTPAQWMKIWNEKDKSKENSDNGEEDSENGDGEEKEGEEKEEETPALPTVKIDFKNIWERAQAITELKGHEGAAFVSPDGKTIIFTSEHQDEDDLYSVRWDGKELERLTQDGASPTEIQFDSKGKTIFYLNKDGAIKRVKLDGDSGDPVPFSARYEVDIRSEREVVFEAAWLALDQNFYDPDFHGVDWPAQKEKYRPWGMEASTDSDFADVVNLMLGELNASHMGYYSPGTRRGDPQSGDSTGWIGVTYDPVAGGPGILIREVLPDSPAARTDVNLHPGDRLLAVNGVEIQENTNVFSFFTDTVEQRLPLLIRKAGGEEESVVITPTGAQDQRRLRYEEWVRERRRLADEHSDGRLGYLHIQGMSIPSFEEFERSLYAAAHGKEGLLIDVRSNGGGWTTDYLMAVLMVKRHAFTVPRGSDPKIRAYPQGRLPLAAYTRPAVTICNEDSYSNAEIFSHAFKELDRGTLIGSPTFGAVISTGGTRLLNGALVRLPFRGWFVASSEMNMENNPAMPDILEAHPPAEDHSTTEDTQLRRAVEVLLADLEDNPRTGAW